MCFVRDPLFKNSFISHYIHTTEFYSNIQEVETDLVGRRLGHFIDPGLPPQTHGGGAMLEKEIFME